MATPSATTMRRWLSIGGMMPLSARRVPLALALSVLLPLQQAAPAGACDTAGFKGFKGLRLGRPVPGAVIQGFGLYKHPLLQIERLHLGVDLAAASGDPVAAAAAGQVVAAKTAGELGNLVQIDHGDGLQTAYGHLGRIDVKVGDCVARGQIVARAGATGLASRPQLHFEVLIDGQQIDPAPTLAAAPPDRK